MRLEPAIRWKPKQHDSSYRELLGVVLRIPNSTELGTLSIYEIALSRPEDVKEVDAVIFAVPHEEFRKIKLVDVKRMYNNTRDGAHAEEAAATLEQELDQREILIDMKEIFDRKEAEDVGFLYWRL